MGVFKYVIPLVVLSLMMGKTVAKDWFDQHQQGWHWYKKTPPPPAPVMKKKSKETKESESSDPKGLNYREKLKEFQDRFEEFQARAVLNPTTENVAAFIKLHDLVLSQASKFQEMWMVASLLTPDMRTANKRSPKGREMNETREQQIFEINLRILARTHGLFFMFKEGCPYCHEFGPLVKDFAATYGFELKAISADGGKLKEFPDAVEDNGVVSLINPNGIYPCLFIVNPQSNEVFPLSWGLINEEDLKENMKHYMNAKAQENQREY